MLFPVDEPFADNKFKFLELRKRKRTQWGKFCAKIANEASSLPVAAADLSKRFSFSIMAKFIYLSAVMFLTL